MSIVETMRFICSGCGYRALIPTSYTGKVILCPGCKQMEIASAHGGNSTGDTVRVARVTTAQGSASVSIPDAEGHLRFTCGGCGYGAKLAGTYAGKAISCPQCKAPQLIPPLAGPKDNVEKKLTPMTHALAAPTVKTKSEDGLSFDDETGSEPSPFPVSSSELVVKKNSAPVAAHDPIDEISFDQEPLANSAVVATPANAVKPPSTRTTFPTNSSRDVGSAQSQTNKPTSGKIVRRGNRMPMPAMAESTAGDDESDDSDSVKIAKPLPEWVQKIKQPKIMASIGGGLAVCIALIVLISAWSNASSSANELKDKLSAAESLSKTHKTGKDDAEFILDRIKIEQGALKKSDAELKTALANAETRLAALGEEVKQAKTKETEQSNLRKVAEEKRDENFTKLKSVEKLRDEDYQRSLELRKKYEEEVKLRKSLQERLEGMVKAQAAAK